MNYASQLPKRKSIRLKCYNYTANGYYFVTICTDFRKPFFQNKKIKKIEKHFWQRNYYEHVIRNEKALLKIREYIQNNPTVERIRFEQFYEVEIY